MSQKPRPCCICRRPRTGLLFCDACRRSYDRDSRGDDTIAAAIVWAARRTRRMMRRRAA